MNRILASLIHSSVIGTFLILITSAANAFTFSQGMIDSSCEIDRPLGATIDCDYFFLEDV